LGKQVTLLFFTKFCYLSLVIGISIFFVKIVDDPSVKRKSRRSTLRQSVENLTNNASDEDFLLNNEIIDEDYVSDEDSEEDVTGLELLKRFEFYLLFISLVLSLGVGLAWKNTLGVLNKALHIDQSSSMVIAWSLLNAFARFSSGVLSDYFALFVRRSFWVVPFSLLNIIMIIVFFFIPSNFIPHVIWMMNVLSALSYGTAYSVLASLTFIYFGRKYVSINMGILLLAPAIGGVSFTRIFKAIEVNATLVNSGQPVGNCNFCFKGIFLVYGGAFVIVLGLVITLAFSKEIKKLFRNLLRGRSTSMITGGTPHK